MGPVVEALERAGASPQRVFRRAGLPFGLVEQPDQLIPLRDQLTLVAIATKELDEATLPLRLSRAGGIESLGAFGQRVLRASTLATSICACNENIQLMLQTMTRMSLTRSGREARWSYELTATIEVGRQENELLAFGYMADFLDRYASCDLIRAELPTAPAEKSRLEEALGCDVRIGEKACLVFPSEFLATEGSYRPLEEPDGQDLLPIPENLEALVENLIKLGLLDANPCVSWVSRRLGVSARTLQRSLSAAGATFENIRKRVLLDRAILLLEGSSIPITEIAHQLGYSDGAHFTRALSRWTGRSPTAWRRKTKVGHSAAS